MYVVHRWQTARSHTDLLCASVAPAGTSTDSPDRGALAGIDSEKCQVFLSIKYSKAEHGRRTERNKYPSERRDTWEDEPSGEHLCLTSTNNLKLNRGRRLRNDVSCFPPPPDSYADKAGVIRACPPTVTPPSSSHRSLF